MTDLDALWLAAQQGVIDRAAHEVKDALNGVHLNLEAARSRAAKAGITAKDVAEFVTAAADQLEAVSERAESILFLTRTHRPPGAPADVAATLRHLARLLVPAARADGHSLAVEEGTEAAPTTAPAHAVRLALAAGFDAITREGDGRCALSTADGTVVRFSHETASTPDLDPVVAEAIGKHQIRTRRSGSDLVIVFPGP